MSGTHIVPSDQCKENAKQRSILASQCDLQCACAQHVPTPPCSRTIFRTSCLRPFPSSSFIFHVLRLCFAHLIHTCELSFLCIGDWSDFLQPLCHLAGKQLSPEASAAQNVTNVAESHPTEPKCFHTSSLSSLLPLRHKGRKEAHVRVRCSLTINNMGGGGQQNKNKKKALASSGGIATERSRCQRLTQATGVFPPRSFSAPLQEKETLLHFLLPFVLHQSPGPTSDPPTAWRAD